jgi:hypothetical protein
VLADTGGLILSDALNILGTGRTICICTPSWTSPPAPRSSRTRKSRGARRRGGYRPSL